MRWEKLNPSLHARDHTVQTARKGGLRFEPGSRRCGRIVRPSHVDSRPRRGNICCHSPGVDRVTRSSPPSGAPTRPVSLPAD
eukprot:364100-Chlamydomonas_euryale.AAC.78